MLNNNEHDSDSSSAHDERLGLLKTWLTATLNDSKLLIKPASADASNRRYFRVWSGQITYIAMDAPSDQDGCRLFALVGRRLQQHGLHVPHIYAEDYTQGFMLLGDLGHTQYLAKLDAKSVGSLYRDALESLYRMQTTVSADSLPEFNARQTATELQIFTDSFLKNHLRINLTAEIGHTLERTYQLLIANILEQPQVFMHRDYHSRNLMVCPDNNPGILDFQGAMHGPITYDLVSLLRDCYIAWPKAQTEDWLRHHYRRLTEAGLVSADLKTFTRWFDWTGMQRHLKAIGLFARLNYRDGKPGFLNDIPRTYSYVVTVCEQYPELSEFAACMQRLLIAERISP